MAIRKPIIAFFLCTSLMNLAACSKTVSSGGVPEEGLTVSELYHQSIIESDKSARLLHSARLKRRVNYEGYVRDAQNETKARFKKLENPAIPIFIYPHVARLGDEELVKPGFSSEFYLYKQNQFALASEQY